MRGTGTKNRRARFRLVAGALAAAATIAVAACGGEDRQDEDEPEGRFPVAITASEFPTRQRLAGTSFLRLGVRNAGNRQIPELAVTISVDPQAIRPFSIRVKQEDLAAPDRPVWILEHDWPKLAQPGETPTELANAPPAGAETANSKTFAFGSLAPGEEIDAVWKVTPVRQGNYMLRYRVDAGLHGNAVAETADGGPATGEFAVRISDVPRQTRVNDQGEVVEVGPAGGQGGQEGGQSSTGNG